VTLGVVAWLVGGCLGSNPNYGGEDAGGDGTLASTAALPSTGSIALDGTASGASGGHGGATGSGTGLPRATSASSSSSSSSSGVAGESSSGQPPVCESVLLVTGDLQVRNSADTPFYERLLELGFSVTVVENGASVVEDVGDHCLVLLSAVGFSSDVQGKFRDVEVPVATWEDDLYDDMRMVDPTDNSNWGTSSQDDITITDMSHPLAAGLGGVVPVFINGGALSWGRPRGDAQIVAVLPQDPTRATIFGFEAGATMANGFVAPARRVAIGSGETTAPVTDAAVDLFAAAVMWALG
jgi:hypothetical protein